MGPTRTERKREWGDGMVSPVLVEATRGGAVESRHRGAFAVVDAAGDVIASAGAIDAPVYPRSAIKMIQALPVVESGAADALRWGNRELALCCSSHSSEPAHVEGVRAMLAGAGLDETALECGAHWPLFTKPPLIDLARARGEPSALHNNCSGKHAGFLALARHEGWETNGYVNAAHPVQRAVRDALMDVTGAAPAAEGTDGCGVPTWSVPLRALAHGFARLATGEGLGNARAAAAKRLVAAMVAEPWFVAGTKRHDTQVMEAAPHAVTLKTGAEGVYCAALPAKGIGVALKIEDGATRAAEVAVAALLALLLDEPHAEAIGAFATRTVRNWTGTETGAIRPTDALAI